MELVSRSLVHPVGVPPAFIEPPTRVRMKDYQGMPGTLGGFLLRLGQIFFAVFSIVMLVSTPDFSQVTAFCYLLIATLLQAVWSLLAGVVDIYALSVRRSLHHWLLISLFTVGDGVTSTMTFAGACATAGITVLIDDDLNNCAHNYCGKYETAAAMAFLSWLMTIPSFLLTFWLLGTG